MKGLQKQLEQREKSELIAMIQQMLRQEPEVQWLLTTPLPTSSQPKISLDPEVYRQQVLAAMEMGNQRRKYKRHEVQRRLLAIKTFADAFANQQQYTAALIYVETLYESFKEGKGTTFPSFGSFYVRPEPESWVFKFNPSQRLRALFGWSSTYSGKL